MKYSYGESKLSVCRARTL